MLCMLLALWLQSWAGSYLAAAALTGTEICSAAGTTQWVDGNGQPLPEGTHHGHDCCLASATAVPPVPLTMTLPALTHAKPALALGTARLSAEVLTPLSRGPPSLS